MHTDALGQAAVQLVDGAVVFADPDVQALRAGAWSVTESVRNGNVPHVLEIAPALGQGGLMPDGPLDETHHPGEARDRAGEASRSQAR